LAFKQLFDTGGWKQPPFFLDDTGGD